jgi:hypothetical protein
VNEGRDNNDFREGRQYVNATFSEEPTLKGQLRCKRFQDSLLRVSLSDAVVPSDGTSRLKASASAADFE